MQSSLEWILPLILIQLKHDILSHFALYYNMPSTFTFFKDKSINHRYFPQIAVSSYSHFKQRKQIDPFVIQ